MTKRSSWLPRFMDVTIRRREISSDSRRNIVDQPCLAEARRGEQTERAVLRSLDAPQRFGVARFEIVDRKPRCFDCEPSLARDLRDRLARCDPRCALLEDAVEHRRDRAFGRREIDVARRQGEAVLLT